MLLKNKKQTNNKMFAIVLVQLLSVKLFQYKHISINLESNICTLIKGTCTAPIGVVHYLKKMGLLVGGG